MLCQVFGRLCGDMVILLKEKRSVTYRILLGVWAMVAAYAIVHDQYIVRIAPEHFTEYHAPMWGIESAEWLAVGYGFRASLAPGLLLGLACVYVGREGPRRKVSVAAILKGALTVIVLSELLSLATGSYVYLTKKPIFSAMFYPEFSHGMLITQTIQLTCYASSAVLSATMLVFMNRWRRNRGGN